VRSDARYVLDTGVLVSALLLPRSVPRQAVDRAFADGIVLASVATIDELDDVLRRPKFDRYVQEDERLRFLARFIRDTSLIAVTDIVSECRDAKDNNCSFAKLNRARLCSTIIPTICAN